MDPFFPFLFPDSGRAPSRGCCGEAHPAQGTTSPPQLCSIRPTTLTFIFAFIFIQTFTGNRPSLSILLPLLSPYTVGQLLSLYENRIAVQGFIWGINSFDQWGVELGKALAGKVRTQMNLARTQSKAVEGFNPSTTALLNRYLQGKTQLLYPEPHDVFPSDIIPASVQALLPRS